MGLTLHHNWEFRGTKTELIKKLSKLRERFLALPVNSVGEIVEVKHASLEFGYGKYRGERFEAAALGFMMAWSYFEDTAPEKKFVKIVNRIKGTANAYKLSPLERQRYERLQDQARVICRRREERIKRSGNGLILRVDVGEGCEQFIVMLGRIGQGKLWRGTRFTKTQYAVHFLKCHLAVVDMLDLCGQAGILKSAHDEGEYFEKRDLEVLAKNINLSTETIRAITSAMKGPAEAAGFKVEAPVEKSADYMKVHKKKGSRKDRKS